MKHGAILLVHVQSTCTIRNQNAQVNCICVHVFASHLVKLCRQGSYRDNCLAHHDVDMS